MITGTSFSDAIPNILIVDDVRANLDLLSGILEERGYQTRPVLNGKLALMSAKADPPDIILLDINMPEMDGFEVCKRLKADAATKDIPIIFLTAFTETADKVKAFSLGAVDYITKPFQTDEIAARVQTHLNIRTLQRRLVDHNANLERLVAERTRELANANSLKNDFLKMISHEIRTPVNGVLGMGELILDLCPASEDRTLYAEVFQESSLRLRNLIEDATMIVDIENVARNDRSAVSFSAILDEVKASHPELRISTTLDADTGTIFLHWNHFLLKRVLETIILLAASFSADKHSVHVTVDVDARTLRMCLDLETLFLSEAAAADFFKMESTARCVSPAESLGLAPVAVNSLISAFGGEMRLFKGENNTGLLKALFIKEQDNHGQQG
jgi:two-component system sensor histidine kinase/response regulator